MLAYNYGPKRMKKYERKLGNTRRKLGNSYPTQRVYWGSPLDDLEQRFPLFSGMYLQKTASKSLLEMLQNTPNMLQKISVITHKFYIEKFELKIYVFDLSKRVLVTEKCNEMTEIISDPNQMPRVCASYGWKLL
jgi:hypothetical protein